MQIIIEKIKELYPVWNQKQLTEDDFYNFCEKNNILVIETPLRYRVKAMLWYVEDEYALTINSEMKGIERLFAMWHEIGHFMMHHPSKTVATYFWGDEMIYGENRREETEADIFATCALIPKKWVETKTFTELLEEEYIPEKFIYQRKKFYEKYELELK